jgi:mRNA interferase MazF
MSRGEVRWYKFSHPNKKRPVLVLTRDSVLGYLGEVTIAPITSTVRGIPSEVELSPADGMRQACAINCDHLQTVAKGRLGALITTLTAEKLADVARAICFALDL